uniref:Uncharacterized protein n=1 Tax=Setaria viridis TaxID=4556 RepID=A0A4U6T897_SETVI|nr:hypothetical protein SEVIR_9G467100v2 [Setaria viridis]
MKNDSSPLSPLFLAPPHAQRLVLTPPPPLVHLVKACHCRLIWLCGVHHRLSSPNWGPGSARSKHFLELWMKRTMPDFARSGRHTARYSDGECGFHGIGEAKGCSKRGRAASARDVSEM